MRGWARAVPRQGQRTPAPRSHGNRRPRRQPRAGVQRSGILRGIHPIAEPQPAAERVQRPSQDSSSTFVRSTLPNHCQSRRLTRESEGPGSATGWTPAGGIEPATGQRAAACEPPKRRGGLATRRQPDLGPAGAALPELLPEAQRGIGAAELTVWWRLPALLVAGVLGPPPERERLAGRASPSVVPGLHHGRHRPQGAGGRGNPGHLWH